MDHCVLLLFAAIVVGASKGGLASAAALAVPMLALVMSPVEAAATLLPVYLVTDWVSVWLYRRDYSKRNLAILIPSMLLGVGLATILTPVLPEAVLLLATGLIGFWFLARDWMNRAVIVPTQAGLVPGIFWGTITGITSFITHSGGPPSQAYLLPQRLPKLVFAGTVAIAFTIGNLAKLPGYWVIGALDRLDWSLTALLVAAGICGTFLGRRVVEMLPEEAYRTAIKTLLLLLSIVLVTKGGLGLL